MHQLGFSEVASLEDLKLIPAICEEMRLARCRLWRVYTSDCDFRPGVWSCFARDGEFCLWNHCWWSGCPGAEFPGLPSMGGKGLIVSFALKRQFQTDTFSGGKACALWQEQLMPFRWPIFAYPIWSHSYFSAVFPKRLPFTVVSLAPFHGCEFIFTEQVWLNKQWPKSSWAKDGLWDWPRSAFSMEIGATARSQVVWLDKAGERFSSWEWPEQSWQKLSLDRRKKQAALAAQIPTCQCP